MGRNKNEKHLSLLKGTETQQLLVSLKPKAAGFDETWDPGAVDLNSWHELDPTPGHTSGHRDAAALGPCTGDRADKGRVLPSGSVPKDWGS